MLNEWVMIVIAAVLFMLLIRAIRLLHDMRSELKQLRGQVPGAAVEPRATGELEQINGKISQFMELHADKMDKVEGHLYECKQHLGILASGE